MYRHFRQWVGTACNNNPFYMQPKLDIVRLVLTFPFIWFSFFLFSHEIQICMDPMTGLIFAHAFYINVSRLAWYALACEFKAFWHVALGYCRLAGNPFFAVVSLFSIRCSAFRTRSFQLLAYTTHTHTRHVFMCIPADTVALCIPTVYVTSAKVAVWGRANSAAGNPPRSLCSFVFVSLPPENYPVQEKAGRRITWHSSFCKLLPIFEGKSVSGCLVYIALKREKKIV